MINRFFTAIIFLAIAGCSAIAVRQLDTLYGPEQVRDRNITVTTATDFQHGAQDVFNRRCLACHACYDAPCQLKMENTAGLDRGASKAVVYDSARLSAAPMTRLGMDAQTTAQWRTKSFYPVLNERDQTPANDLDASVLHRMLVLKANNPLPTGILPQDIFDFSLSAAQSCPSLEEMPDYERTHPQWGMPFGLPALDPAKMATLTAWLKAGAKSRQPSPLADQYVEQLKQWENFFNGATLKEQLMSRYMYEHLFLADIYFDQLGTQEHFRLVRSRTPPGQPIDLIATRRPYNDPGVSRPYYRLQRSSDTLVAKTHMAYAINTERMQRWQSLFLAPDFQVGTLPDYQLATASNPFVTFQALPLQARYQFMLDQAQYTIMGFIKGPVCRGQIALDVIEDNFWVWFVDPKAEIAAHDAAFLAREMKTLDLPAEEGNDNLRLFAWKHFAKNETAYLKAKAAHEKAAYGKDGKDGSLSPDMIWNGDGDNRNAALTILRHFNSATVVKGLVGEEPKTAWIIDYPLLERIHYLLVTGYDVYGNVTEQLFSRVYMDFLRIGGELNFVSMLPQDVRTKTLDYWYRGADSTIAKYLSEYQQLYASSSGLKYVGSNPQHALYQQLKTRVGKALATRYELARSTLPAATKAELTRLAAASGMPISWLPELAFVSLETANGPRAITLVHNDGYSNVASLFGEQKRRLPAEDTLTVVPGFLGAYPNALFKVKEHDLGKFVTAIAGLASESDYAALMSNFGVRRSNPDFWAHSDLIYDQVEKLDYADRGVLDYSRLDNR